MKGKFGQRNFNKEVDENDFDVEFQRQRFSILLDNEIRIFILKYKIESADFFICTGARHDFSTSTNSQSIQKIKTWKYLRCK